MQPSKTLAHLSVDQRLRIDRNRLQAIARKQQRESNAVKHPHQNAESRVKDESLNAHLSTSVQVESSTELQHLLQANPPPQFLESPEMRQSSSMLQAGDTNFTCQTLKDPVKSTKNEAMTNISIPSGSRCSSHPEDMSKKRALPVSFGKGKEQGGSCCDNKTQTAPAVPKKKRILPDSFKGISIEAQLPSLRYSQEILYCRTNAEAVQAVARLRGSKALGFDIEWWVTFEHGVAPRGVATIQLCSSECCAIFQTSGYSSIPLELAALLADKEVLKVGVGASRDAIKVADDLGIPAFGVLNLEDMIEKKVKPDGLDSCLGGNSLATLCLRVLGRSLIKPSALRISNWEASPLSYEQLSYAATDAYAGLRVFDVLCTWLDRPSPPRPPECRS
jgi:hypothetical protein